MSEEAPALDKQSTLQYFEHHNIKANIQSALNQLARVKPGEPYAFLAQYLKKLEKPQVVFVMGAAGVGKTVQCARLATEFGFVHLQPQEVLRVEEVRGSVIGLMVAQCNTDSKPVPVELVARALHDAIQRAAAQGKTRFLVDGFPHSQEEWTCWQAEVRDTAVVRFLLFFEAPEFLLEKRLVQCGRADANQLDTTKKKFRNFLASAVPVFQTFDQQGKAHQISSVASADHVFGATHRLLASTWDSQQLQTTLGMIKPDAVALGHTQAILNHITNAGFTVVQRRQITLSPHMAGQLYSEHRGEPFFHNLQDTMTSGPVLLLALRRVNAVEEWRRLMGPSNPARAKVEAPNSLRALYGQEGSKNAVHGSRSIDGAFRELALFFPHVCFSLQSTLAIIKPDAADREKVEAIKATIANAGLQVLAEKVVHFTTRTAEEFYSSHSNKPYFRDLVKFMTSGGCVALCLRGANCINEWRELMGPANSVDAKESGEESIRAVYGTDHTKNAVHGSRSTRAANRELAAVMGSALPLHNTIAKTVVVAGPPASGKGTQCTMICNAFGYVHIRSGDVVREAIAAKTEIGVQVKACLDEGKAIPDMTMTSLVLEKLHMPEVLRRGCLLDGYPRNEFQAHALQKADIPISAFLHLQVDDAALQDRVVGRRIDPETGVIYHLTFKPPPPEIAGRCIQRASDTVEKIKLGIVQFNDNIAKLKRSYEEVLHPIDGNRAPEETFEDIVAALAN